MAVQLLVRWGGPGLAHQRDRGERRVSAEWDGAGTAGGRRGRAQVAEDLEKDLRRELESRTVVLREALLSSAAVEPRIVA